MRNEQEKPRRRTGVGRCGAGQAQTPREDGAGQAHVNQTPSEDDARVFFRFPEVT